jgi:prepilin-type N-terminal cleavage/methylation domain-containing protein
MRNRRGFTLIETLTVVTVTSVLLATAAGLLHTVFQWQQRGREGLHQRLAMDRLAQQFREDAHAATGLTATEVLTGEGQKKLPGWRLELWDDFQSRPTKDGYQSRPTQSAGRRTVQYWVAGDTLARSERAGDKLVAWEGFALPPGAKVEMALQGDGKPAMARLRIAAATEPSAGALPPLLLVEGAMGLDRRFAGPGRNPKTEIRNPK